MALTFGEYLMTRRLHRQTTNPALIQRIQATPGLVDVTNFNELTKVVGAFSSSEEIGIKVYWRSYQSQLKSKDPQIERC